MNEVIARVEKVCKENEDILWWIKTYYEVDILLDGLLEMYDEEDNDCEDKITTLTTVDILNEMFTENQDCYLPREDYIDDTIDGMEFHDYCMELQKKKKGKAA